jgi:hypothetical protein
VEILMTRYGGPPTWVSKQNEAILRADTDRISSELEQMKRENAELRKELETAREALRKCEKRLSEEEIQ